MVKWLEGDRNGDGDSDTDGYLRAFTSRGGGRILLLLEGWLVGPPIGLLLRGFPLDVPRALVSKVSPCIAKLNCLTNLPLPPKETALCRLPCTDHKQLIIVPVKEPR